MSKTKIFIIVIAIAAIGIAAMIIVSSNSPVSPGVSDKTNGTGTAVENEAPVDTSATETKVLNDTTATEGAPAEKIEGPGTQEVDGTSYKIVYKTETEGGLITYEVLTGKINKQKVEVLVKKIVADLTGTNPALKAFTLNFYSSQSLIDESKVDVATVSWASGKTSIKMIGE